jgi:hypothetical protein
MRSLLQSVDNKGLLVWHHDCYIEGASDEPAAERNPDSPKKRRRPARASANEAALKKGKTGRVEQPPTKKDAGRPVTSSQ